MFSAAAEPCEPPCQVPNQNIPPGPGGISAPPAAAPGASSAPGPAASASPSTSGVAAPQAAGSSHHSPYDLRRKSPSHHDLGASTSAGGPPGTLPSSTASTAGPSFSTTTAPARKRLRRTCSTNYEGKTYSTFNPDLFVLIDIYF